MAVSSYVDTTPNSTPLTSSSVDALSAADAEFLHTLGKQLRTLRKQRGLTRKLLAHAAEVSERYLGQLESGEGNVSIILLRRIASALNVTLGHLLPLEGQESIRRQRIALIGLRGAGKTALGQKLAGEIQAPFIELDREIEREIGLPLNELFTLYGQSEYRRLERRCLERVLKAHDRAVIAVGGGVVSEEDSFQLLLAQCHTIWLKATPEEHMERVIAQGDLRPMAGNNRAMEELKRKAHAIVDTSGSTIEESLLALQQSLAISTQSKGGQTWNPQSRR